MAKINRFQVRFDSIMPEIHLSGIFFVILWSISFSADSPFISTYFKRLLLKTRFETDTLNPPDSAISSMAIYRFSYDCPYIEKVIRPDNKEISYTGFYSPDHFVQWSTTTGKWGVDAYWDYYLNRFKLEESDQNIATDGATDCSYFGLGGWYEHGICRINTGVSVDYHNLTEIHSSLLKKRLINWFNSPAIDLQFSLILDLKYIQGKIYLENSAPFQFSTILKNTDNGASRNFTVEMDINKTGLELEYDRKGVRFSFEFAGFTMDGNLDTSISSDMSIIPDGGGFYAAFTGDNHKNHYKPHLEISGTVANCNIKGMDRKQFTFLNIQQNRLETVQGKITFKPGKLETGILAEYITAGFEKGLIELAPFSSWFAILGLPLRYKLDNCNLRISNMGFLLNKKWSKKVHKICFDGALSYCSADASVQTKEIVEYLGLPRIQNQKVNNLTNSNFILIKADFRYDLQFKRISFYSQLGQWIPLELSKHKNSRTLESKQSAVKHSVFGGFHLKTGIAFN